MKLILENWRKYLSESIRDVAASQGRYLTPRDDVRYGRGMGGHKKTEKNTYENICTVGMVTVRTAANISDKNPFSLAPLIALTIA